MVRTFVLFSGGLDSAAMLFHYRQVLPPSQLEALIFSYGQRHTCEIYHAITIASLLDVSYQVVHIEPSLLLSTSALVYGEKRKDTLVDVQNAFIPCRNALFLTIAANRAYLSNPEYVQLAVGSTASDHLPDQSKSFYLYMETALKKGLNCPVVINHPNIDMEKKELIWNTMHVSEIKGTTGKDILSLSYTCYSGTEPPCGTCHACTDRAKAFDLAGYPDPALQ